MLNDHNNDKFEGGEESEYHFSDEEVSYEVENEPVEGDAPAKATESAGGPKESLVSQLTRSKRMLISAGVFFALIFVVYKMVSPTTTSVPSTDIAAVPPTNQGAMPAANVAANNTAQTTATTPAAPAVAPAPAAVAPQTVVSAQPADITVAAPAGVPPQPEQPIVAATPPPAQMPAVAPAVQPVVQAQAPIQPEVQQPPIAPVAAPTPAQQAAAIVSSLPSVIPVQAPAPVVSQGQATTATTTSSVLGLSSDREAALSANSERLMGQLQGQFTQQYNDFSNQNKALQEQIQTLTSRVSVMENQLNQLVQALTRKNQGSTMASPSAAPAMAQSQASLETKVAYNVQAIIPGRAWLKSDNGETLTVAEGDTIKDVGRVTKIDPYDGVVEINTGSKAVSLSYGNG